MATKQDRCRKRLDAAFRAGTVIGIRRAGFRNDYAKPVGFVAGLGRKWVLLHTVESSLYLNGYTAFRIRDITKVMAHDDRFVDVRALALQGVDRELRPELSLERTRDLLSSGDAHFGLVTIHVEYDDPEVCFIGRVAHVGKRWVRLDEIDPRARWRGPRFRYRLRAISRVDFGGEYERALLLVGGNRPV